MKKHVAISLVVVSLVSLAFVSASPASEPPCVVAAEWVKANANRLPATLEDLKPFDRAHRKAIFRAHKPEVRTALWEQHLSAFEVAHPDLTAEQRAFVAKVRDILPQAMHLTLSKDEIDQLALQSVELFGLDRAKAAFVTLGDPTSDFSALDDSRHNSSAEVAEPDCECDGDSGGVEWCGINFDCDFFEDCDSSFFGCGWLGAEGCFGMCDFVG